MGSCGLRKEDSVLQTTALHKTMSMPLLGPHAPCGRRVGDDLGMSEAGSEPGDVPALRRQPRLHGGLEGRLAFLEQSFSGPRVPLANSVTAASFTATAGTSVSGRGTATPASGRGIATPASQGSRGIG